MTRFQQYDLNIAPNELAREILEMFNEDQTARFTGVDPEKIKQIDTKNTERVKEMISEHGYPTIGKIGPEASHALWLLVQHADHDINFQKKCLKLMKKLPGSSINKTNIAYLEDRVRVGDGKPQLYGTQFYRNKDGKLVLRDIEEIENVDRRREQMNLGDLEEYKKLFQ